MKHCSVAFVVTSGGGEGIGEERGGVGGGFAVTSRGNNTWLCGGSAVLKRSLFAECVESSGASAG